MKTIRINEKCDKIITKMAKRLGSTKTDFVRIVIENLADYQITDIWKKNFDKTAATVPENSSIGQKVKDEYEPDEEVDDDPKFTSYGDIICKKCGMGSYECDCVEEIDWDEDEEEEEE